MATVPRLLLLDLGILSFRRVVGQEKREELGIAGKVDTYSETVVFCL